MSDFPWIDPREVDDLAQRYPTVARQQHDAEESLDYTPSPPTADAESGRSPRL